MDAKQPAVVITGFGLVTPFGSNREAILDAIRTGATATRWLSEPPPAGSNTPGLFAGAPAQFESQFDEDPVIEMALQAATDAMRDANLQSHSHPLHRCGTVMGTSKGALARYGEDFRSSQAASALPGEAIADGMPVYPGLQPNTPALRVAAELNFGGPCLCPVAACATGLQSVSRGVQLIEDGHADVVLAGSSDASICDWVLSSFQRLGVLARRFVDPARAIRPFEDDREGFLVGEGAAAFVLERAELATARDATVRGHWLGSISAGDPTGLTQIDESGAVLIEALRRLLKNQRVPTASVDHINLHGTATIPNDRAEARAIRQIFGDEPPPTSAHKRAIGHLLGAAGSVELGMAMLDLEANSGGRLLKTSLGFGGHIHAAIVDVPAVATART